MFSLLKIKHTKQLIVVKSSNVTRKRKKDYWIKLENGKRCVGIFLCKSDERHTLLEIKKNIDTSSPKIIIKDINKLSNIQYTNNETICNKNKVMSNHSEITESVQSTPDTNIKKPMYDQLDEENDENINPHLTKIALKHNAKILRFQCSNSKTNNECKNTKEFDLLDIDSSVIQDNNTINYKKPIYNNQFEIKRSVYDHSSKIVLKRKTQLSNLQYINTKPECNTNQKSNFSKTVDAEIQNNIDTNTKRKVQLSNVQYINSKPECNTNQESIFSKTVDAEIQKNTDTNTKELDYDLLDNEQINIINDDKFISNTEMINQFYNQYEDPNNMVNSYLDLDMESDFHYNDEFQTNVISNENLESYVLDKIISFRNYPRIIENKKCKINMTVLPKNMDSTADSSFNISILEKSLESFDINVTDTNNSTNFTTSLINNNSKEMIHEILAENKSVSTPVCGNIELDSTLVTFCDLNKVNNSSIVNNNDELYYNNPQIANVSQNIGFKKDKISINVSYDEDPDYEPTIYSQSSNNTYIDIENGKNYEIDDLEVANKSDISGNCSENEIINEDNMLVENETRICKDDELFVELSRGPKGDKKSNFCLYCNTMQTKIARHLELKHRNEEEVKKFLSLPKKSGERREAISQIRKKGNFKFNTQADLNGGSMIVVRRPTKKEKQCGSYFLPCSNCEGHYAIHNLRHHYRICAKKKDTVRNILQLGRSAAQSVHNRASIKLRKVILPIMRNDNIYSLIKYDLLIILYGNYLCQIHRLQHLGDHIRQQLRLVGRYLEALRSIEPRIEELQMLFDPKYYDIAIKAVNIVAKYNEDTESYEVPYNATALGTCLKKLCKILINEFIKQHEYEKQKLAKNFLKILEVEYGSTVNKTVTETQTRNRRKKIVNLPKTSDIKKLTNYLEKERVSCMREIENEFTFRAWKSLAEVILILIQIFNRRRAGEIERAYIADYKNFMKITEKDELYKRLPERERISALKYIRFIIRGKLNRNVPVLLNAKMKETIEVILKYRELAGVSSKNPYIFGLPSTDKRRFMYLRASKLMREFSNICGAENKRSLRGTILRKDMATKCAHLPDTEISLIADFMGHHKDIHKNIYRQPVAESDILNMAKILEKTQNISSHNTTDTTNTTNTTNTTDTTSNSVISNTTMNTNISENSINKIQNTVEDGTSESDTLPLVKNLKKTSLKRKNINKHAIENEYNPDEECAKKKKRFTLPYGKTRRIRWTEKEIKTALVLFEKYFNNSTLPSLKEISSKTRNNILKNRQPAAIKSWLHNQIRNAKRNKC